MEEKTQAVTFNDDSTISTEVGGKSIKLVPLNDLVKVKDGLETAKTEWEGKETKFNTDLAEAKRLQTENNQSRIQAEAAKEEAEKSKVDAEPLKSKITELETETASQKEKITGHETEMSNRIRASLIAAGAKEEAIKDKNLEQLRSLEEAAKLFGNGKGGLPAKYDAGSPGGSDTSGMSSRSKIAAGLKANSGAIAK